MNRNHPTIAFSIGMFNAVDGPAYCVYTQAYGMEMQVDDEWPLNILIMAPPHLVSTLTKTANVASVGMIPGASYTPGDGDYKQISDNGGAWVLARPTDDLKKITEHQLGVLLLVDSADQVHIPDGAGLNSDNLIVAFQIDSVSDIDSARSKANAIRSKLPDRCVEATILVSGSFEHSNLLEFASIDNVSGLLLLDAPFERILDLVEQILG